MNYKRILLTAGILFAGLIIGSRLLGTPEEPIPVNISDFGVCYQTAPYNNEILLLGGDGIRAVSTSGNTSWTISERSNNPYMHIAGSYILLADLNGKTLSVYRGSAHLYTIKTGNTIKTAKVSSDGSSAVLTEEIGFKGLVTVYGSNGGEIYKWYSGEGYILDIALSAKVLAVSQMLSNNDAASSSIFIIDIESGHTPASLTRDDEIISALKFSNGGRLIAVSTKEMLGIEKDGTVKFTISFGGRSLSTFNIDNDNNMVVALTGAQNNIRLEMYNRDGRKRGECQINNDVRNISVSGDYILVNELRDVLKISPSGRRTEIHTANHDIKSLTLWKNHNYVWIMGSSQANIIKLK